MPIQYIILIIVLVLAAILGVLFYFGRKLQLKQVEQKEQMAAMAQNVSMLIIDKKIMKLKEAGLPDIVLEQTPKYMRRTKLPIVKAKVGPKIVTLIADAKVYEVLPVKKEVKVVLSGIYITEIKSVRGGAIPKPEPQKQGLFARFKKDK